MAWTTYGVRDGSRGETDDKLGRCGSTRGIMPQVKTTHPAPAIVEGHERGNEIFVERFMNSIRSDLDPFFGGFGEVVSCSKERVGHGCVYIVQVERRFSKLRGSNLKDMVIL